MRHTLSTGMALMCASALAWGCGDDAIIDDPTFTPPGTTTNDPTATGPLDPTTGGEPTSVGTGEDTTAGSATTAPTTGLDSSSSGGTGPVCGDDFVEGDEACDGRDLGGASCESQGFDGGTIACTEDCFAYDTSGCFMANCNNGAIEGAELCDGADLGGATCASEGFDGGTLACSNDCTSFDTSECSTCGNVIVEGDEPCDGVALLGETCEDQGFDSGQIACLADCSGFDTTGCGLCGNGVRDGGEVCDGMDLGGETCLSQGLGNGNLGCLASCLYSFTGCELASGALLTVRTGDAMLRALDPATLVLTDVGLLGVGFDFGEVAYDTTNDILWMIDGRPAEALYTVNMATGAASLVGVHGIEDLFGLAHDPTTNTLFGSGESPTGFYGMNQMTGAASFIGDPALAADGLTYDSTRDQIVALAAGGGQMFSINRMTGAPTMLSNEGFINNCGLAYDPFLDLYWAIDWSGDLYTYDPNAAYTRTLVLSGLGAHDGLTYVQGFTP